MQKLMQIHARTDAHNSELDGRDDKLKTARASLVTQTGALVGESAS
jgi:hypothetical protein